ncbi:MAG: hypothetical protein FWE63_05840 [Bacteroidales bacterium]|nr:hypothetical protein [Bacteroidales bacterium]
MKKTILIVCFLSLFGTIHAQAFKIGENRASFGLGFGWVHKDPVPKSLNLPSPNILVERSLLPFKGLGFISIGAQFGFHHGLSLEKDKQTWTAVYFVPRVALYFHEIWDEDDFPENIDLYGGVGFGFRFLSHKISSSIEGEIKDRSGFNLGYNFFIGGRYYFKPHASIFAELGYGLSFLNAGITIRY